VHHIKNSEQYGLFSFLFNINTTARIAKNAVTERWEPLYDRQTAEIYYENDLLFGLHGEKYIEQTGGSPE
jgi:hypothetical protein